MKAIGLLFFTAVVSTFAQVHTPPTLPALRPGTGTLTFDLVNGRWWATQSQEMKATYLKGFFDSLHAVHEDGWRPDMSFGGYFTTKGGVSLNKMVEGLDELYKLQFPVCKTCPLMNTDDIPLAWALKLVDRKFEGIVTSDQFKMSAETVEIGIQMGRAEDQVVKTLNDLRNAPIDPVRK
jgi:hypothetical protein